MNTDRHDGCHSRQPGVKGDQERRSRHLAGHLDERG
jgi:hypothetical protein